MKKRIFSLIAVLCMLVCNMPTFMVFAEESGECGENLTWILDDKGTLTISGIGEMEEWENGVGMPWKALDKDIKKVIIQNGVTSISEEAFSFCENITEIYIPDSVTSIGNGVLNFCTGLLRIFVSENNACYASDEYGVLYNKDKTELIQYPSANTRDYFDIPAGVKTIVGNSFFRSKNLINVKIPDSVTKIGERAFYDCDALKSITVPSSVKEIGYSAFSDCGNLTDVKLQEGITSIPRGMLLRCAEVLSIEIPDGVIKIGAAAFSGCNKLKNATIPDSVTHINDYAFYDCNELNDVYYGGSEYEWERMYIGDENHNFIWATRHYSGKSPDKNEIVVMLNGVEIEFDVLPIIQDGRTLVPLRAIFEALGASVDWNGDTQTVTSEKDGVIIVMTIGNNIMYKNGAKVALDVSPQIVDSRTLVPVRVIAESFGCKVDWVHSNRTVVIEN